MSCYDDIRQEVNHERAPPMAIGRLRLLVRLLYLKWHLAASEVRGPPRRLCCCEHLEKPDGCLGGTLPYLVKFMSLPGAGAPLATAIANEQDFFPRTNLQAAAMIVTPTIELLTSNFLARSKLPQRLSRVAAARCAEWGGLWIRRLSCGVDTLSATYSSSFLSLSLLSIK